MQPEKQPKEEEKASVPADLEPEIDLTEKSSAEKPSDGGVQFLAPTEIDQLFPVDEKMLFRIGYLQYKTLQFSFFYRSLVFP